MVCAGTFGFRERLRIGNHRAQLLCEGGGAVIVVERGATATGAPDALHSVMVRVGDASSHFRHTAVRGAKILKALADFPYGERQYTVEDLDGHVWTFSQSIADSDPASWGGALIAPA